jgi:hypothetical protein
MKTPQEWLDTTPGYAELGPAEQAVARLFVDRIQRDALTGSPTLTDDVMRMRAEAAERKIRLFLEHLTALREAMLRVGWPDVVTQIDKTIERLA